MKEKIISLVPSYDPNHEYLDRTLNSLNKISKSILFTTENKTFNADNVICFDKSIGKNLVYETRKWIMNNIDSDWDYIIYNEDDILIDVKSVENVLHLYTTLPPEFIPGFIRYEIDENFEKRYIDMHPEHSVHRQGIGSVKKVIENQNIWEPWNIHSGNWILSKKDIKNLINNNVNQFLFQQTISHVLLLDNIRGEKLFELLPFKSFAVDNILRNYEYE